MIEYKFRVKYKIQRTGEEMEYIQAVESDKKIINSGDLYGACIREMSQILDLNHIEIKSITYCDEQKQTARKMLSLENLKTIMTWDEYEHAYLDSMNEFNMTKIVDQNYGKGLCRLWLINDSIPVYYEKNYYEFSEADRTKYEPLDCEPFPYGKMTYKIYVGRYKVEWYYLGGCGYKDTPSTGLWELSVFNRSSCLYDTPIEVSINEVEKILMGEYDMLSKLSRSDIYFRKISGYPKVYFENIAVLKKES